MPQKAFLVELICLTLVIGCGQQSIDPEARFDATVENSWAKDSIWVDAVKHLSSGGKFMDTGETGDPVLDVPQVLPVLQRLREEFRLEWQAITEERNPKQALAIVAKLPEDTMIREKVKLAIDREQKSFPGAILYQWGHRWLAINFLTQEQVDFIEQSTKQSMDEFIGQN